MLALLAAEALAETLALDADALPESEAAEPDAPEAALELDDEQLDEIAGGGHHVGNKFIWED